MAKTLIETGKKFRRYHDDNDPTKFEIEITEHDRFYKDEAGVWNEIKEAFEPDGLDGFIYKASKMNHCVRVDNAGGRQWMPRREFPGEFVTVGKPQYYSGKKWKTIPFLGNSKTGGIFTLNGTNYTLQVTVNWRRIKLTLTLKDASAPTRFRFPMSLTGITYSEGVFNGGDGAAVGIMTQTTAEDANGEPLTVAENYSNGYVDFSVSKTLDDGSAAAYPITIDPDFAGSTADAYIYGMSLYLSTAQYTSTYIVNNTNLFLGNHFLNMKYYVYRSFLKFDTSAIGSGSTVTKVNLKMYMVTNSFKGTAFNVVIVNYDWSGRDPLTDANRELAYDGSSGGNVDNSFLFSGSSSSPVGSYTSGDLKTNWVNVTGNTYYASRLNTQGTAGAEHISFASADHATVSYRPVLIVEYTVPPPSSARVLGMAVQSM